MTAALFSKFETSYNGKVMALIVSSSYLRLELMFDLLRLIHDCFLHAVSSPSKFEVNDQHRFQKLLNTRMTLFMSEDLLKD